MDWGKPREPFSNYELKLKDQFLLVPKHTPQLIFITSWSWRCCHISEQRKPGPQGEVRCRGALVQVTGATVHSEVPMAMHPAGGGHCHSHHLSHTGAWPPAGPVRRYPPLLTWGAGNSFILCRPAHPCQLTLPPCGQEAG